MSAEAGHSRELSNPPTALRLAIARQLADEVRSRDCVHAVLATGSVARGRCSSDSDLDLTIVTAGVEPRCVESRTIDGVTIDLEWLPVQDALAVVSPPRPHLKALRDAARLGQAFVVFDRAGLADHLRSAAAALRPDRNEMRETLEGAYRTLLVAIGPMRGHTDAQWDALRGIYDAVAFVLLQLSPHRYQKPKWVVHDLRAAGHAGVLRGLLGTYGAAQLRADRALGVAAATEALLNAAARRLDQPDYRATLALGYTETHAQFSFICRCLEDARSLLADGALRAGVYTARSTARMALAFVAMERGSADAGAGGTLRLLAGLQDDELTRLYAAVFPRRTADRAPDRDDFEHCRRSIDRAERACLRTYRRPRAAAHTGGSTS